MRFDELPPPPSSDRRSHSSRESQQSPDHRISSSVLSCDVRRWDRIRTIEFAGNADFYDMYVPGPENYVAEGIVHHNTGLGKGRELASIILDYFRSVDEHNQRAGLSTDRKPRKSVWISKSRKLLEDAQRDWADIGQDPDDIFPIDQYKPTDTIDRPAGILFCTYATLRSKAKAAEGNPIDINGVRLEPGSRLLQVFQWLGPDSDAVMGWDESHQMKNSATIEKKK